MKLLIAISGCMDHEGEGGRNDAARETCLADAKAYGVDYKIFLGHSDRCNRQHKSKDDVVVLPVRDDWMGLLSKHREKLKWVHEAGYDFVFSAYADTYFRIERLMSSGFEQYDYFGHFCSPDYGVNHCQGGQGYFASRKLCKIVEQELIPAVENGTTRAGKDACYYFSYCEDVWTGALVECHADLNIKDSRDMIDLWTPEDVGPRKDNNIISCHLSPIKPVYKPEYMIRKHQEFLDSMKG